MKTDTIAAIATALSDSGIGIIRISGEDAIVVADSVFVTKGGRRKLQQVESHTIHYGYIVDDEIDEINKIRKSREFHENNFIDRKDNILTGTVNEKMHVECISDENSFFENNEIENKQIENKQENCIDKCDVFKCNIDNNLCSSISNKVSSNSFDKDKWKKHIVDEVMVAVMKAPRSYTMEDTVEINCHGGVLVMQKILETVLKAGARIAEPGEFTKRAFLNGRIDLSKAEAVIDVIHSQNEFALVSSMSQLKGNLSEKIKGIREKVIYEIAFIESALDDPEHISLDGYPEELLKKVNDLLEQIGSLIDTSDNGKLIKEGISTVIVGKPNAGKSSLLNLMVGEERAIVTDIAGTTRDVLQESIKLHGIGLNIIDTAGIHDTEDVVEKIGVEKAKKYAKDADLILYVVDSSVELDESDREIIPLLENKRAIILLNKTDLFSVVDEEKLNCLMEEILPSHEEVVMIRTSTKEHMGIDSFENTIRDMFFRGQLKNNNEVIITNMRHKEALQDAYDSLTMVKRSIEDGMPEDFYSIDLMSAYSSLGMIIGEEVGEDLVNEIFSKFCMGK